ncbi:MAG: glucodextranase DOMON-like domain-containing protein [bacterium]
MKTKKPFLCLGIVVPILLSSALLADEKPLGPSVTDEGILFRFEAPGAQQVFIAGEFNGWAPTEDALNKISDDLWEIVIPLKPGRYEYKFVIDGSQWRHDPYSPGYVPDPYGGQNSVVTILPDGSIDRSGRSGLPEPRGSDVITKKLHLAIVWHQHQPRYFKDPVTGEYAEPWVRIHGIKDYFDMVAILDHYPGMKFTVNLTPVLISQLEEMIAAYDSWRSKGGEYIPGCDKWLRLTLKEPRDLTKDDKIFILRNFFRMPRQTMIDPYPRFGELAGKKIGDSPDALAATIERFTDQDWRDLQCWFNLAEFDPDFKEGSVLLPDGSSVSVKHLIEKGSGFTEQDKFEIIDSQFKILRNIIPVHKENLESGKIEITTSPFYHPILPLIYDTDIGAKANPTIELPKSRFSFPQDAKMQIEIACDYFKKIFGRPPSGMWPSEGAVSAEIIPLFEQNGIKWIATDEEVLKKSLGMDALGKFEKYQPYLLKDHPPVAIIFRDRQLSDDIGFRYSRIRGADAAKDLIEKLRRIAAQLEGADGDFVVAIIMDGENAWEHFERDGKEFLHTFYSLVCQTDWLVPVTVSEFLERFPPQRRLANLSPGSWIGGNFDTWIGEEEENIAWSYLTSTRQFYEDTRLNLSDELGREVMEEILIAEGSDWFWWYGADQGSGSDEVFDEAFRKTLSRVYTLSGVEPPYYLSIPIVLPEAFKPNRGIGGIILPEIDGMLTKHDEWEKASYIDCQGQSVIANLAFIQDVYYGYSPDVFFLRVDLEDKIDSLENCQIELLLSGRQDSPIASVVEPGSKHKIEPAFGVSNRLSVKFDRGLATANIYKASENGDWDIVATPQIKAKNIIELALPFETMGLNGGERLRFTLMAMKDGMLVQRIPQVSFLELIVPRSGLFLLRSLDDPMGDDRGPGYYRYPQDPVFKDGCFDITNLDVMLDAEDNIVFKIGIRGEITSPWGGITGYCLQAIDIYIDTDGVIGSGKQELARARNAMTVAEHCWEYFVRACMDTVALYDAKGRKNISSAIKSYPDKSTSSIYVVFPRSLIDGGKNWNVIVAMLGHDGYSYGGIRPVKSSSGQWVFGGCDVESLCPNIMDLVVEPGESQYEMLGSYRKTRSLARIKGINIPLLGNR